MLMQRRGVGSAAPNQQQLVPSLMHPRMQQQQQPPCSGTCALTTAAAARQQQQDSIQQQQLPHGLQRAQLPRHVAIIMDGNSRWATRQGLPALVGHERGVAALKGAVDAALAWGLPALTVFAFSTENWQRQRAEVAFLMELFSSALQRHLPELQAKGVRVVFFGDLASLPPGLQQQAAACAAATADNTGLLLGVALAYGGRQDVVAAAQALAGLVQAGQLQPEQITAELLSQHLSSAAVTSAAGPPDLILRTSDEQRLSNFLLYDSAYAELVFLDVAWPAFRPEHFAAALTEYAQRQRRYGRRR